MGEHSGHYKYTGSCDCSSSPPPEEISLDPLRRTKCQIYHSRFPIDQNAGISHRREIVIFLTGNKQYRAEQGTNQSVLHAAKIQVSSSGKYEENKGGQGHPTDPLIDFIQFNNFHDSKIILFWTISGNFYPIILYQNIFQGINLFHSEEIDVFMHKDRLLGISLAIQKERHTNRLRKFCNAFFGKDFFKFLLNRSQLFYANRTSGFTLYLVNKIGLIMDRRTGINIGAPIDAFFGLLAGHLSDYKQ